MNEVLISTVFFWFLIQFKKLLFWSYLWQVKEYHWGRMRAHLLTLRGRRIIFNPKRWVKIIFFISFPLLGENRLLLVLVGFLLAFEGLSFSYKFSRRRVVKPVFTKRILASLFLGCALIFLWAGHFLFRAGPAQLIFFLLLFDILAPLFFYGAIMVFQPLVRVWHRHLIKKAKAKMQRLENVRVVGVTGSYGKSSVKDFLAQIILEKYEVVETPKSQNSTVGITSCILNRLTEEHQIFVCEIGAYGKGEVREMAEMVQPQIGIVTGINEQHLATFGSLQNIVEEKFELVEALPEKGTAVLNWDNELVRGRLAAFSGYGQLKTIKCSSRGEADLWAEKIEVGRDKLSFVLVSAEGAKAKVELGLVGAQNIINFLMAAGAAQAIGMSLDEIGRRAGRIEPPESGMRLKQGRGGVAVIDDTYSANPHGVNSAVEHLRLWPGKKVVVMPCLIELGRESGRIHREIGGRLGQVCDLVVITKPDCFEEIRKGAVEAGMKQDKIVFLEKTDEILKEMEPYLKKGSVVLLESRLPSELVRGLLNNN